MKFTISPHNCQFSSSTYHLIDHYTNKLMQRLPNMEYDLSLLALSLKRQSHQKYSGSLILRLPRRPLVASMTGYSMEESIKKGFARLMGELARYKAHYFSSDPKHYDRKTIRGMVEPLVVY